MSARIAEWLEGYREAWVQRDPDAVAELFTEDARYVEQPYAEAFAGREGIRDYWARVTATQSDVELQYGILVVSGQHAAVEWWVTMTNGGADVTLAGEFLLRFNEDGLCSELREYWHFAEGRLTPPAEWGA